MTDRRLTLGAANMAAALLATAPVAAAIRASQDTPPRKLTLDKRQPHYSREALQRGVGVRFKGVEKTNVFEYDADEGWVRLIVGTALDRHGNPRTVKLQGKVEAYYRR